MTVAPTPVRLGRARHRTRWLLIAIAALLAGTLALALLGRADLIGGSADPATQRRDLAPFVSVDLAGSNNVVVHVGKPQSVVVKADRDLLDRVTTDVQSGRLVIAETPGDLRSKSPMSVDVGVPTLTAVTLSGSGNIVLDGIRAKRFEVTLPGSGTLTASGTATQLGVTVSGSGTVQFQRLVAQHVRPVVSGSGTILVTATDSLDATVSGTGAILYFGNPPDVSKIVTGSGAIVGNP